MPLRPQALSEAERAYALARLRCLGQLLRAIRMAALKRRSPRLLVPLFLAACVLLLLAAPVRGQNDDNENEDFGSQISSWFSSLQDDPWPVATYCKDDNVDGECDEVEERGRLDVTERYGTSNFIVGNNVDHDGTIVSGTEVDGDCGTSDKIVLLDYETSPGGRQVVRAVATKFPLSLPTGGTIFAKLKQIASPSEPGTCSAYDAKLRLEYSTQVEGAGTAPNPYPADNSWRVYNERTVSAELLAKTYDDFDEVYFPVYADAPPINNRLGKDGETVVENCDGEDCTGTAFWRIVQENEGPSPELAAGAHVWAVQRFDVRGTINEPYYVTMVAVVVGLVLGVYWVVLDRHFYRRAAKRNRYLLMGVKVRYVVAPAGVGRRGDADTSCVVLGTGPGHELRVLRQGVLDHGVVLGVCAAVVVLVPAQHPVAQLLPV